MARKETNKVFDADAKSLHPLFICEGGVAGFRIPIYQRHYDWDKANIQRFFEDVLSGLTWRVTDEDSLTFMGTIIVLDEETKEEEAFDGHSLSVIDGQQRLTTISLLACILHEELRKEIESLPEIPDYVMQWIDNESRFVRTRLLNFAFGQLPVDGSEYFPFPRIVREEIDCRGNNPRDAEYRSVIACYLNEFSTYIREKKEPPFEFRQETHTQEVEAFLKNLKYVRTFTDFIRNLSEDPTTDISINLPRAEDFEKSGFRRLFSKFPHDQSLTNKILSYCKENGDTTLGILRLLAFAAYLMDAVIVTLVKARDQKYAFDIFDALNTTGEPLTAVQTFKPQVIKFEKEQGKGYTGSLSEEYMKIVENYLEKFPSSDARQKEAKDLIVPFALYLTGTKVSRSLDEQRRYLRSKFEQIHGESAVKDKRCFVRRLAEMADYKERFWLNSNLETQLSGFPNRDLLLLCLKFLKDLNSSLTIPLLCRYYSAWQAEEDKPSLAEAIKAITAFVVLRRGATGGTSGIDSDLRSIMSYGRRRKDITSIPLCVGLQKQNSIVDIPTLREYLREWLSKNRIEIENKKSWVHKVSVQDIYSASTHLCRFLLLAATHNARPDEKEPWKFVKARPGLENQYLTYHQWVADECATVEHIAPDSATKSGWDNSIYSQPYLKHCLGNLTLLPQEENSTAANNSWSKKKKLYQAFAAETKGDVDRIISEAKKEGVNFSKKNIEILNNGTHLPLAKTIASVDHWSREIIEKRSKNIAELAWDEISPWLFGS